MRETEQLRTGLEKLIEVSEILCARIEQHDLTEVPALIAQRGALLEEQAQLLNEWKMSKTDERQRAVHEARPLLATLEPLDTKTVKLLAERMASAAIQLRQAQNQKRLLAYSI
jgi:hypothetical protein